tara:strand:- start:362 stop:1396 length:1035 start_codon:yes stop_codon:yes gene_type:complete
MKKLIKKNDSFYVAGHTGMVGSAIIRALKKNNYCNPLLGGKLLTEKRENLNLENNDMVLNWFKKNNPNVVIIAAAKVGGISANNNYPFDFISNNLRIQSNIIESAFKVGARRLLFLGSSCIYPKNAIQPIKEEYLLTGKLEVTNESYAIAKIAGIKLCDALRKQHKFDSFSLMPTNLYGPGDNYHPEDSHVIASLIRKFIIAKKHNLNSVVCWGSGTPLREFLHVDDLGSACIHVLENWDYNLDSAPKDADGNKLTFLNIGSGKEISIKELSEIVAKSCEYNGEIIWDMSMPDGTFRKKLDSSKIKSLGWEPKIPLEDGIINVIKDIKEIMLKDPKSKSIKNFF